MHAIKMFFASCDIVSPFEFRSCGKHYNNFTTHERKVIHNKFEEIIDKAHSERVMAGDKVLKGVIALPMGIIDACNIMTEEEWIEFILFVPSFSIMAMGLSYAIMHPEIIKPCNPSYILASKVLVLMLSTSVGSVLLKNRHHLTSMMDYRFQMIKCNLSILKKINASYEEILKGKRSFEAFLKIKSKLLLYPNIPGIIGQDIFEDAMQKANLKLKK
jgi:hypothetical protein